MICALCKIYDYVEETLTDFLRHHKKVLKQVDKHVVVLRRTGGKPAVRLSLESDASANEARLSMLAAAVAALPKGSARALFVNLLFPWSRFLPEHDRSTFEDSLIETLQACASRMLDASFTSSKPPRATRRRRTAEAYSTSPSTGRWVLRSVIGLVAGARYGSYHRPSTWLGIQAVIA